MPTDRKARSPSWRLPAARARHRYLLLLVLFLLFCRPVTGREEIQVLDESWHILRLRGMPFGMLQSRMEKHNTEPPVVRTTQTTHITVRRMGIPFEASVRMEFVEDVAGHLLSYRRIANLGGSETVQNGTVRDGKMEITTTGEGASSERVIPWEAEVLGPYGERTLLLKSGFKEGFTASYKLFVPDFATITNATLKVIGKEATDIGANTFTLNKVLLEQSVIPSLKLEAWYDDEGGLFKSHTNFLGGLITFRVDEEEALAPFAGETPDIILLFMIPSNIVINNPRRVRSAEYMLTATGMDPARYLPSEDYQQVERISDDTARVTVKAVKANRDANAAPPAEEFRRGNFYIQSDDEEVRALSDSITDEADTPWGRAKALERWVNDNIREKSMSVGFATAKTVLRTRAGDCTEHSVLLAALLRAAGIPSRVASGLVYSDGAFCYHMWTEAYIGSAWTPLDATLSAESVDATHIKLADSSLADADLERMFRGLAPVLGKLKVEVRDYATEE